MNNDYPDDFERDYEAAGTDDYGDDTAYGYGDDSSMEEGVPVYLIAGFLEGGKTQFLDFTLKQDYFQIDGVTLLIVCEEGEEEYDQDSLLKYKVAVEYIHGEENLTPEKLQQLQEKYYPDRVAIEYNGMWMVSKFLQMELPEDWEINQQIVCVDASTFQLYMQNMKPLFMDMVRSADMVFFNRASRDLPLANFRRSVKVENPKAEVIFEDGTGEITDIFQDALPFDISQPQIEIPLSDYGIWFVDASENPGNYDGKRVTFEARLVHPRFAPPNYFQMARPVMTCCAQDIQMLGFVCHMLPEAEVDPKEYENGGVWCQITADVTVETRREYGGEEGLILHVRQVESCLPPKDEVVSFN